MQKNPEWEVKISGAGWKDTLLCYDYEEVKEKVAKALIENIEMILTITIEDLNF